MYPKGHIGLTLLLVTLLMIPFGYSESAFYIIIISAALSSLPDIDMKLRKYGVKHSGRLTHSLFFAILVGSLLGVLFYYTHKTLPWAGIGFLSGFLGVVSHLIGDTFTYHAFKPLWPISQIEVSFGFCAAGDRSVNEGLMTVGGITFIIYFLISTVFKHVLSFRHV